jgi:hypothetical protein
MNILFSSFSGNDLTQSIHYHRVLIRLGHQVFKFAIPAALDDLKQHAWVEPGFAPETTLDSLARLSGFTPDLFMYIEPMGLIPRGMEKAPFPTVCLLCDTHCDLESRLRMARFFDHVFLYQCNYLKFFNEHPSGHLHWHPYACDLEFFHPLNVERDLDVALIGQVTSERKRILSTLAQSYRINEQHYYWQKEISGVYSRAKIVLNLPHADDLNFRTFEALSCGALLLTKRIKNGQELLFQEGVHYAAFADEHELFAKVDYYLSHEKERAAMAAAGLEEVWQRHRLEQRIPEILDIVKSNPEAVAPIRRMSPSQVDLAYAKLYEQWRLADSGLKLAREARNGGRPFLPVLFPALRSVLRVLLR